MFISSLTLVGSVNYLLELAEFVTPDQSLTMEWKKESYGDIPDMVHEVDANESKMNVFVKIDEPDIFLVEDISDPDSDALMLNTELQLKYWSVQDTYSIMAR